MLIYPRIVREPESVARPECMQVWNPIKSLAHVIAHANWLITFKTEDMRALPVPKMSFVKVKNVEVFPNVDLKTAAEGR